MKKYFILLFMLIPMLSWAQEPVQIDDIWYNIIEEDKVAEVTNKTGGTTDGRESYSGRITIPEKVEYNGITYSVTSIGSNAFYYCSGLKSVTIANSVTSIGNFAFRGCDHLLSIIVPDSVESIGEFAFYYCSSMSSITIPNSVIRIGRMAFSHTLWDYHQPDGLLYVGQVAYQYYGNMPANTSISIKPGTKGIAGEAFSGCSGLTSITIPNSVTSIGDFAFYGCSSLPSIDIPNSVKEIGSSAFSGCSGLTTITIGSGVTYVGSNAFASCNNLESVTCLAEEVPSTKGDAFKNTHIEYVLLRVPDQSQAAYNSIDPWKNFGKIEGLNSGVSMEKCATPVISFINGQIKATSTTEGAVCHMEYSYKTSGSGSATNSLNVAASIIVTSYATVSGYLQSETATATFDLIQLSVNDIQAELEVLQKELAEKKAEITSLQSDIDQKTSEITKLKKQLEDANGENASVLAQIEAKEAEIKGLKNELSTLKASAEELERTIAQLKEENTSLNQSINILAVSNSQLKAEVEGLRGDVATLQQINEELKESNALLTESNERQNAELAENAETIASLKAENATLSDELSLYCLGDMNKDGKTDLEDVVMLLTMDSYSGDADALAQLAEETSITLTQIDERYGDVEYYKLNGVKVDKPTQPGVYLVKKDGQTKMIVVKK